MAGDRAAPRAHGGVVGVAGVSGELVAPGAVMEGTVGATGAITGGDWGAAMLGKGDTLPAEVGDVVRFTIADEGRAYLIPTR